MRILSLIALFGFFHTPFLFSSERSPLEFHVTEELQANPEEFNKLLEHPSLKDLMKNRLIKRPEKCPIENLTVSELHKKLRIITKAFDYGECAKGQTGAILKGLGEITGKVNTFMTAAQNPENSYDLLSSLSSITDLESSSTGAEEASEELVATAENLESADYYSRVSSYLADLSESNDCMTNLRRQGFLGTLGDVITTMGQTSLLVPSSSGFLFSAAGIAVGSSLKILGSLFKSPFDWDDPEERAQFESLSCSFFKLRRDIESAHVFGVNEKKTKEELTTITKQIKAITDYKNRLLEEQKKRNQTVLTLKENYYKAHQKLGLYNLHKEIDSFIKQIETETAKTSPNKSQVIKYISDLAKKITPMETFSGLEDLEIIKSILDHFDDAKSILELHKKKYPDLYAEAIEPLLVYLKTNKTRFDKDLLIPTKEFLALKRTEESKSNQDIIKLIDSSYLKLLQKVGDTTVYLNTQVQLLSNALKRFQFNENDDGSHMDFNVNEEYLKIQKAIYEKNGYPYLSFFKESAYDSYKQYEKDYEKIERGKLAPTFNKDLPWLCRSAKQTIIRWSLANHAVESIWDFLKANESIFYQNVKKVRLWGKILPIGHTKQYKLYKDARSAEIAKGLYYQEIEERKEKEKERKERDQKEKRILEALAKQEETEKLARREARTQMSLEERKKDIKASKLKKKKRKEEKREQERLLKRIAQERKRDREKTPTLIYNRRELSPYGWRTKKNLGKLILKVKYSEKEIKDIVDFRDEYQCTKYD